MRNLVHFSITGAQQRVRITQAPAIGQETIFSENFLVNRVAVEYPGKNLIQRADWPLPPGSIITVSPDAAGQPSMTFRVDRIGPYDPPAYGNAVVFATRLT